MDNNIKDSDISLINLSNLAQEALEEAVNTKKLSTNQNNKDAMDLNSNIDINNSEKDAILEYEYSKYEGIDIRSIAMAYCVLFFILIIFIPKIYLANNIYYISKNIHYLQSQKESLKNENLELQKSLESTKFNLLTLDIEEIQ